MATTAPQTFTRFAVRPITPYIGAEIEGVDMGADLADEVVAEIRRALLTYKVIFFRDQDITEEQHIAFGRRFGTLEIHPATPKDQPNPEMFHIRTGGAKTNKAGEYGNGRFGVDIWHSDVSWRAEPSLGSILRGRTMPEVGGDTMWSDQVAAYEGLSPAMREWLCTLTAVHDGSDFAKMTGMTREQWWERYPLQEHPVVRTHPETGERALYVNRAFTRSIKGLSDKESDWLLDHLYAQASRPEYQVRFRWRENSFAFWDNRASQHYAVCDYAPAARHVERVTIAGDKPFFDPAR